jgi:DNA (cytosine-5)-methyltransferase 1
MKALSQNESTIGTMPKLLDLFCGAGGAAKGYAMAGYEVLGVDKFKQPRYPYEFVQADALEFPLDGFDVIHASPPCQAYSATQSIWDWRHYPKVIEELRQRLDNRGIPYIIENVAGAPLIDPIMLCGAMFPGLFVYRHHRFETNWQLRQPPHPEHTVRQAKLGRPVKEGEFMQVVGNYSNRPYARKAMGIDWMTRDELTQAVPPPYTEWIGRQLLARTNIELGRRCLNRLDDKRRCVRLTSSRSGFCMECVIERTYFEAETRSALR